MSNKQAMWSVMAMLTIWCTWNSVNINNMNHDHKSVEEIASNLVIEYKEEVAETMTNCFNEAFAQARAEQGENGMFTWNEKQYTTKYAIEGDLASK
tara:strand:+ start:132 stop:419 length:288 start_codon:yes stop_codon:yes gene_type:complete